MYLVHEQKHMDGKWEIAWMWLPHFLALDQELHRRVGRKMTEEFKGTPMEKEGETREAMLKRMHDRVIYLILEKYQMPGLKKYLEAVIHLQPSEEPDL